MNPQNYNYRPLGATDIEFLKEMFYVSLFVPPGEAPFPKSILQEPGLLKYYEGWGRVNDYGLIVEAEGQAIGAVWSRFFTADQPSYGFVAEDIPELGIALREGYRGLGLGTTLLHRFFELLRSKGIRQVSLSVDPRNSAFGLYQKLGFREVGTAGTSITMCLDL